MSFKTLLKAKDEAVIAYEQADAALSEALQVREMAEADLAAATQALEAGPLTAPSAMCSGKRSHHSTVAWRSTHDPQYSTRSSEEVASGNWASISRFRARNRKQWAFRSWKPYYLCETASIPHNDQRLAGVVCRVVAVTHAARNAIPTISSRTGHARDCRRMPRAASGRYSPPIHRQGRMVTGHKCQQAV